MRLQVLMQTRDELAAGIVESDRGRGPIRQGALMERQRGELIPLCLLTFLGGVPVLEYAPTPLPSHSSEILRSPDAFHWRPLLFRAIYGSFEYWAKRSTVVSWPARDIPHGCLALLVLKWRIGCATLLWRMNVA